MTLREQSDRRTRSMQELGGTIAGICAAVAGGIAVAVLVWAVIHLV